MPRAVPDAATGRRSVRPPPRPNDASPGQSRAARATAAGVPDELHPPHLGRRVVELELLAGAVVLLVVALTGLSQVRAPLAETLSTAAC